MVGFDLYQVHPRLPWWRTCDNTIVKRKQGTIWRPGKNPLNTRTLVSMINKDQNKHPQKRWPDFLHSIIVRLKIFFESVTVDSAIYR